MEYLDAMSFLPDFVALLPEEYKPGIQIFVGDRSDPLTDFDTVHLCWGLLVRAFSGSIPNPRRALTLQAKLTRAWDEFYDLDVDGSLDPDYSRFVVGVLEPAELPRAFPTLEGDLNEIKSAVARFLHRPIASFQLLEPLIDAPALAILGTPVSRLFGVVPDDCAGWIPVFVDPKEVAQHVRIILLPPVPLTMSDFLRYAHVRIPERYEPRLVGLGAVQEVLPRLRFRPQAAVPAQETGCALERFPVDSDTDDCSDRQDPQSQHSSPHVSRERSPRARGASNARDTLQQNSSRGRSTTDHCDHLEPNSACMWNRGFSVMTAPSLRPPEDTSTFGTVRESIHPQRIVLNELLRNRLWQIDGRLTADS